MSERTGQAIALDLIAAFAIALLIFAYFMISWSSFSERYVENSEREGADLAALSVSDVLVSSPGYPENWTLNATGVKTLGLARTPNVLDPYKVAALSSMPYAYTKAALGLERDFYIRVESPQGVRYATAGTLPNSSSVASEVIRIAMLNGTVVHVRVLIYG